MLSRKCAEAETGLESIVILKMCIFRIKKELLTYAPTDKFVEFLFNILHVQHFLSEILGNYKIT